MIKIFLQMKAGKEKETIESYAQDGLLTTRFSDVGRAWKVWSDLKGNGLTTIKRNVVIQKFENKTEVELADMAQAQAEKVMEDLRKQGKIKFVLERTTE